MLSSLKFMTISNSFNSVVNEQQIKIEENRCDGDDIDDDRSIAIYIWDFSFAIYLFKARRSDHFHRSKWHCS